jgi:hypothetical protein
MKAGVRISPRVVVITPLRALPSLAPIWKPKPCAILPDPPIAAAPLRENRRKAKTGVSRPANPLDLCSTFPTL